GVALGIEALGALDLAVVLVDLGYAFGVHAAGPVQHQRDAEQLLDRLDALEVDAVLALELVGAVAGADRDGQRVAAGLFHEAHGLGGVGQARVALIDLDVVLDAAQAPELGLYCDAAVAVGVVGGLTRQGDVFFQRVVRAVDHHAG